MTSPLEDARKEMDEEFAQFRNKGLGRIHEAVDRVVAAAWSAPVPKATAKPERTGSKPAVTRSGRRYRCS
jgi:hypothetical protein